LEYLPDAEAGARKGERLVHQAGKRNGALRLGEADRRQQDDRLQRPADDAKVVGRFRAECYADVACALAERLNDLGRWQHMEVEGYVGMRLAKSACRFGRAGR